MGGKKKYIEMFGSFMEPFSWKTPSEGFNIFVFQFLHHHRITLAS